MTDTLPRGWPLVGYRVLDPAGLQTLDVEVAS
jgi:hypothetical protein